MVRTNQTFGVDTVWAVVVLWGLHLVWQVFAMTVTCLFSFGLPFEGVVSYCFGFGYVLICYVGVDYTGPCPVTDWRWAVGACVMLLLSILPFYLQRKWQRQAVCLLLLATQVLSACYTFRNMVTAIT